MTNKRSGFTLIELVVAIAVLAILITLAAPNFRTAIDSSRLASASNDLIATLQFARSEAVRRNQRIEVCPTSEPSEPSADCSSSNDGWDLGWMVLDPDPCSSDDDEPGDACDRRLRIGGPVNGLTVGADRRVAFNSRGNLDAGQVVEINLAADATGQARRICLLANGRAFAFRPDENQPCQ